MPRIANPAVVISGRSDGTLEKVISGAKSQVKGLVDEVQTLINTKKAMWAADGADYQKALYRQSGMHTGSAIPGTVPGVGQSRFFSHTSGEFAQQRGSKAEQDYDAAVFTYYAKQEADLSQRKLQDSQLSAIRTRTSAAEQRLAARVLRQLETADAAATGVIARASVDTETPGSYASRVSAQKAAHDANRQDLGQDILSRAMIQHNRDLADDAWIVNARRDLGRDILGRANAQHWQDLDNEAKSAKHDKGYYGYQNSVAPALDVTVDRRRAAVVSRHESNTRLDNAFGHATYEESSVNRLNMLRMMAGVNNAASPWQMNEANRVRESENLAIGLRHSAYRHSSREFGFAEISASERRAAERRRNPLDFGPRPTDLPDVPVLPHVQRAQYGGLTRQGSHRFSFAAQNVGFGIDDAIQSYQFGGIRASIRAASNNATAVAAMAISNPMLAAGAVVAVSIATAVLPMVLARFGLREAYQSLTQRQRQDLHNEDPKRYAAEKKMADFGEVVANQRQNNISWSESSLTFSKSAIAGKGFASAISNRREEATGLVVKSGWLTDEQKKLEAENHRIDNEALHNWWGRTATQEKSWESNASRIEQIKQERVVLTSQSAMQWQQTQEWAAIAKNVAPLTKEKGLADYRLSQQMDNGLLSREEYEAALIKNSQLEKRIARRSNLKAENLKNAEVRIDLELEDQMNDPLVDERIRKNRLQHKWHVEDQMRNSNPERNPLKAFDVSIDRDLEEWEENKKHNTDKENRDIFRSMVAGFEKKNRDLITPAGTRSFMSTGYEVDSAEDFELKARAQGNFGPRGEVEKDRSAMTMQELLNEVKELRKQIEIEVKKFS